jgi:hypothetical protein
MISFLPSAVAPNASCERQETVASGLSAMDASTGTAEEGGQNVESMSRGKNDRYPYLT